MQLYFLSVGVSLAAKTIKPSVQVIGVEPANVASYAAAVAAGKPVNGFKEATIADGLAVPVVGPTSFQVARHFVDSSCVVSEKKIALAMLRLIEMEKVVVEGGGAAALASILPEGPLFGQFRGKKVVVLLCGGNIDTSVLGRVIDRGLSADSRLIRFGATVSDRPGGIARLAHDMAELGASVKVSTVGVTCNCFFYFALFGLISLCMVFPFLHIFIFFPCFCAVGYSS